jgi:hypothetical protein
MLMAQVEEEIVREYFEQNGFLVRALRAEEPRRGRKKAGEGATALLVVNPEAVADPAAAVDFFLFSTDLVRLPRACISLQGAPAWLSQPGLHRSSAQIFRFVQQNFGRKSGDAGEVDGMGADERPRFLVLPGLPTAEPYRSQTADLLRQHGFDGVLSFRAMLSDVASRADPSTPNSSSTLLEGIRVLKMFDLLTDAQMELFRRG